jgi:hypothetical protein
MQGDPRRLPPCSMSAHCLRLLDDLDQPSVSQQLEELSFTNDVQDERLVEQLRAHVPTCPTCTAALAQARRVRAQQRTLLRNMLRDNEQKVPSTTAQILTAILQEPRTFRPSEADSQNNNNHHRSPNILPLAQLDGRRLQQAQEKSERRSQVIFRNAVALTAVAAIIVAAVGIFNRYNFLHSSTGSSTPSPEVALTGWSSVIIGLAVASKGTGAADEMVVANYDPVSKRSEPLSSLPVPANTQLDGISHDGKSLLYHYAASDGKTHYSILSRGTDRPLFSTPGEGSKGVWSVDSLSPTDRYVYIGTTSGITEVDVHARTSRTIVSSLNTLQPQFYRNGYLYFEKAGELYRVNTAHGTQQPVIQRGKYSSFADYLLSPDPNGSTIYYVDRTPGGAFGIHSVNSDGTNPQNLRQDPEAMLLGFAQDNSLVFMHQTAPGKYAVVKLGATAQHDQVLLEDAAPGATSIDEANTALAPFAHELIISGTDQNGNRTIWFDNLATRTSTILLQPGNDTQVQIPGWDRLIVPAATSTPIVGVTATLEPTLPPRAFAGWNAAAIAEPVDSGNDLWGVTNYSYLAAQSVPLIPGNLHSPLFDGISPDGKNLLYQISSGGHMLYYTLQQLPNTGFFYQLNEGNAMNAIWMSPGSRDVLIATVNSGVVQVNTQTGQSTALLPNLKTAGIRFYRDGYLYFIGAEDRATGVLYRINASSGVVQQVTFRSLGATYWLSPDGRTVYFANKVGPAGNPGIYAVNSDGTNLRLLRPYADGTPIGYAANNALEIMRLVNDKFEVVELGATAQQDQVVFADAAPGAVSLCNSAAIAAANLICDHNIALAPLGHALIVQATYADGSIKVWSDDVTTGNRLLLQTPAKGSPVQLIGWDRLAA